jgi:hypothetical protein
MFEIGLQAEAHRQQLILEAEHHRLAQADSKNALNLYALFKYAGAQGRRLWNSHFRKDIVRVVETCVSLLLRQKRNVLNAEFPLNSLFDTRE